MRHNPEPDTVCISTEDFVRGFGQPVDGDDDEDEDEDEDADDEATTHAANNAPTPSTLHHNPCAELIAKITAARATMERASA